MKMRVDDVDTFVRNEGYHFEEGSVFNILAPYCRELASSKLASNQSAPSDSSPLARVRLRSLGKSGEEREGRWERERGLRKRGFTGEREKRTRRGSSGKKKRREEEREAEVAAHVWLI